MAKHYVFLLALMLSTSGFSMAQSREMAGNKALHALQTQYETFRGHFEKAYTAFPEIPRGVLEAIAFTNTRFAHAGMPGEAEACNGMPRVHGVMGLVYDGRGYFRENIKTVAGLSGYPVFQIINDAETNILAYASAYDKMMKQKNLQGKPLQKQIPVIIALSELPDADDVGNFALNSFLYSVLYFLNAPEYCAMCGTQPYEMDMEEVFGAENLSVLRSSRVMIINKEIRNEKGIKYRRIKIKNRNAKSLDYPPALWDEACTDNYSSRAGTPISAITLHTVQGSYSSCISWFNNCSAHVSAHYVIRSLDGQVTQMVREANKAWHVGTENSYTVGYEHEGWVDNPAWYTTAMYESSADLTIDICNSGYGINPRRCFWGPASSGQYVVNCPKIKGHQNYPNQTHTDPGINWDWNYYYKLVNSDRIPTTYTAASGNLYDSGGQSANYSNNEGLLWLIQPTGATSVTVSFSSFSIEANWDYLYIYDGSTVFSPLIGTYTGTNSPGSVASSGGSLLVEFRSDCATTGTGWAASYTSSTGSSGPVNLQVNMVPCPNDDVIFSWTNSGPGWYIGLSTDSTFTDYYWKWVSGLSTYAGFGGFLDHIDGTPIVFQPGTKYFWFIRANGIDYPGPSFITHVCSSTLPSNLQVVAPGCGNPHATFSWTNTGTNWTVEVSTDSTFAAKSVKSVSGIGTTQAPAGFSPPFYFQHNSYYYWRIFNGSAYTSGPEFLSPMCDSIAPTSQIFIGASWQTGDFDADFFDEDDSLGTGIADRFHQTLFLETGEWKANPLTGFFADEFTSVLNGCYSIPPGGGTWNIDAGALKQGDTVSSNTNIFTFLNQNLSESYLYHFRAKLNTASGNRRFGLHFFADSGSAVNRGNSYFVWFRNNSLSGENSLEFYKCMWSGGVNVYSLQKAVTGVYTLPGVWYDIKVIYNRNTGIISVFQNDVFLDSWTDPSPLASGKYVSFRTASCSVSLDDFHVFRSRYTTANITVGADSTQAARSQSPDPLTAACKIRSAAVDVAGNISPIAEFLTNIDWTPPAPVSPINDGPSNDIDTIFAHELSANWNASADINSGINCYEYAVGTAPGDSNFLNWASSGISTAITENSVLLSDGQQYYFSVRAKNQAGLISATSTTDGQLFINTTGTGSEKKDIAFHVFPNPASGFAYIFFPQYCRGKFKIELFDVAGRCIKQLLYDEITSESDPVFMDLEDISGGIYLLKAESDQNSYITHLIIQ